MKNLIILLFLSLIELSAFSQTAPLDTSKEVNISFEEVATRDHSALFTINLNFGSNNVDRVFFDDGKNIVFVKEMTKSSGYVHLIWEVYPLACNSDFKWALVVHDHIRGNIRKSEPIKFTTKECEKDPKDKKRR